MNKCPNCSHILYPSVAAGTVVNVTNNDITFRGNVRGDATFTIRTGKFLFDEFTTGDKIYYSYALSKKPFNTSLSSGQPDYNDWYDPDTHPDIVD